MCLPPPALGLSLLEIYFSRLYNAPILFFKQLLFQDFLAGTIPGFLLKALYANATLCATCIFACFFAPLTSSQISQPRKGGPHRIDSALRTRRSENLSEVRIDLGESRNRGSDVFHGNKSISICLPSARSHADILVRGRQFEDWRSMPWLVVHDTVLFLFGRD